MRSVHFSGLKCDSCNYVFSGEEGLKLVATKVPCPKCSALGSRKNFPNTVAHKLLDTIFDYSGHEFLPPILFCILFESLFEEFLENLLSKRGRETEKVENILKRNWRIKDRLEIFKKYIGKSFKETLDSNINWKNFYGHWNRIKEKRDKFLHGNPYALNSKVSEESVKLSKKIFSLFIWLHNRFCAENV